MHTLARRVNRIGFGGWSVSKHRVNRVTRRLEINLVKVVRYQKGPSLNTHCEHMSIHIIFLSFVEWANQFSNQSVRSRWPNLRRFFNLAQISQNMLHSTVLSIFSLLSRCGHVVRDFESEAKSRCNFTVKTNTLIPMPP